MAGKGKKGDSATADAPGQNEAGVNAPASESEQPVINDSDNSHDVVAQHGISIKNVGRSRRLEPLTKTEIPAGATVHLEPDDVDQVRKNIAQINTIARFSVLVEVGS